ncbi:MBL fold metallo-hydrolase [Desulfocurvus sp. DL9XJH121]
MDIRTFTLGPLSTNGYLLTDGKEAVFVDPGGDPAVVLDTLGDLGLKLTQIIITHLHCDHIYGTASLARATDAPVLVSEMDAPTLKTGVGGGGFMGLPKVEPFEYRDLPAGDAEFLGQAVRVLHTPGHTPGSLSLYFPDQGVVFVGDLLFRRSIGRTDFPGGSESDLFASVRREIFTLPDETVVYSGHGPETTVGDERLHNPFFRASGGWM